MISLLNDFAMKKGKEKLNKLIASAEQMLFDRKMGTDSISAYLSREAKGLLADLHGGGEVESMTDYISKLAPLQEGAGAYGHDLYDMMNEVAGAGEPEVVLQGMVEEEIARRANENFVGEDEIVLPDNFFASDLAAAELAGLPATHLLKAHEYNNIRQYFHSERTFDNLSLREQTLVESMRYDGPDFAKNFGIQDQGLYHELRTQLSSELVQSGDMSLSEINSMKNVEMPFEITMQTYNTNRMMAGGFVNRDAPAGELNLEQDIAAVRQAAYQGEQEIRDMVYELSLIHISEPTRPY